MHLFLEGPVQTGKSTLIRQCIAPYIGRIGGFSSQRLWQASRPCGYRLAPADELELDAAFAPDAPGIFLWHNRDSSYKDPSVFETLGVRLLEQSGDKPVILLDEIGGSELLVPAFRKKLYQILSGQTPCLGVIKLASKASFMSRAAGYSGEVVDYNLQLRSDLEKLFHGEICPFEQEHREEIKRKIELFLERIFRDVETVRPSHQPSSL